MRFKYQNISIFMIVLLFNVANLLAEPPDTLWTRTYGGSSDDFGMFVQQTLDSGYIIVGWTESFGAGDVDVYLIKTDANGDTLWTKTYGGPREDAGNWVQPTSDGGYIITGYTYSFGAGRYDVYLIKTDSIGDTIWTRTFGGEMYDQGWSVLETSAGDYLVAGFTQSFGDLLYDIYLIKTDANGNTIWTRYYPEPLTQWINSISKTSDGEFILAGYTGYYNDWNAYLVKVDMNGDVIWTNSYGGRRDDYAWQVKPTSDGGYIFVGWTTSFGAGEEDIYLVKTNANGDTLWTKTFGGSEEDKAKSVCQTPDGGYIIAGSTFSSGADGADIYIIRTDADGDTIWTKTYGGTEWDRGSSVQVTFDGGYIITGFTSSFGAGGADFYLLKTCPELGTEENRKVNKYFPLADLEIIPNPFCEKAEIKYTITGQSKINLKIYDIEGRLIRRFDHTTLKRTDRVIWDARDNSGKKVSCGVYCLTFEVGEHKALKRLLVMR